MLFRSGKSPPICGGRGEAEKYISSSATSGDQMNDIKHNLGASLVAQWLTIRLPMQGTRVQALIQEDPTCCGATKPQCHDY